MQDYFQRIDLGYNPRVVTIRSGTDEDVLHNDVSHFMEEHKLKRESGEHINPVGKHSFLFQWEEYPSGFLQGFSPFHL